MEKASSKIKDKINLIIGASGGIGGATARLILNTGGKVINLSRTECKIDGVVNYYADVEKPQTLQQAIDNALKKFGRIDNFIYSAGASLASPIELTQEDDFKHIYEVNFFGFVRSLKKIIPIMRCNGGGRVVVVSSVGATVPIVFQSFYSSSKSAINMLVSTLNFELNPYNIFLTSVLPGPTCTRFTSHRKVYSRDDCGCYGNKVLVAATRLGKMEQGGDDPAVTAKTIASVLLNSNPPPLVVAGLKSKLSKAVYKALPRFISYPVTSKIYGQQ